MKLEYNGYVLEIIEECRPNCFSTKCEEPNLSFNTLRVSITLENLIIEFKRRVDNLLIKNKEITKDKDQEVRLINQLISDLNQIADEMEIVEKNDYYEVVLEAKLMKLMKSYSESLCLGTTMNIYRSHYNYVLKQREKKENEEEILEVTCEQDVWHNREVRNMKNERDLKRLKELRK